MTGFVSCLPDSNNRQQSTTNDNKALQQRQGIELKTTDYNLRKRSPSPSNSCFNPHPLHPINLIFTINTTTLLLRQSPAPLSNTTPLFLRQSPSSLSKPHPYSYVNHHLHYQHHTLIPTSITIFTTNTTTVLLCQSPSSLPTPQPYSYVNHHLL